MIEPTEEEMKCSNERGPGFLKTLSSSSGVAPISRPFSVIGRWTDFWTILIIPCDIFMPINLAMQRTANITGQNSSHNLPPRHSASPSKHIRIIMTRLTQSNMRGLWRDKFLGQDWKSSLDRQCYLPFRKFKNHDCMSFERIHKGA